MLRKFLGNFSLLFLLNILIKPVWIFWIDRGVQNHPDAGSEYGLYAALFNFTFLGAILLDLGMTNYINRTIAQSTRLAQKYLGRLLLFKLLLGVGYLTVIGGLGYVVGYRGHELTFLVMLAINQLLMSLVLFLRSFLTALMMFKWDAMVSILDRLLMIVLCGTVLKGMIDGWDMTIQLFIGFQTIAYIFVTLLILILLFKKLNWYAISLDLKFGWLVIRQSLPYAMLILLMSFYYRLDAFMVERLADEGVVQAGIYAKGFRVLDAVSMLAYLSSTILLPIFARQLIMGERVQPLAKTAIGLLLPGAVVAAAIGVFYSHEIMDLLYVTEIGSAAEIWQMLMPCLIPICLSYVLGTLLTSDGRMKELNWMALTTAILNVVLNLIFIQTMQAKGAAVASLITQVVSAVWQLWLVSRIYHLEEIKTQLFKVGGFALLVLGVFYAVQQFEWAWVKSLSIASSLSIVAFLIFGFIQIKDFKRTLN